MNRALALAAPLVAALLAAGCSPSKEKCHSPLIECGGKCVDASRDAANCGGCGTTCAAGKTCCGSCVDLAADDLNCGACGTRCPIGGSCSGSACSCPDTAATVCGAGGGFPGKCVDLDTDPVYCGTCGQACFSPLLASTTEATCSGGACTCSGSATTCAGKSPLCRNTASDPAACGPHCLTCPPHAICASGTCQCSPTGPDPDFCGTTTGCVNLQTDPNHCGACSGPGTVCSGTTPSCNGGHCCPSGQGWCNGACINVLTDASNCGSCGNACASGQVCSSGHCTCTNGGSFCGGTCCAPGAGCCTGLGNVTTCMTGHDNGLGQLFFDCTPSYTTTTTTASTASAAAVAWGATTQLDASAIGCGSSCRAGQKPGQCAVWCFDGSPFTGRVLEASTPACAAIACPFDGTAWHSWPVP